jgi:predicted MPP superfamily phosphohydrolase
VAVLGNHDHWAGAPGVRRALLRGGADVLDNACTTLHLAGQTLQVVGLDDAYTGHADRHRALHGLNPRLPTLGLSHIAEEADALWAAGVPLVLSGHTHAGQLTVARLHELMIGRFAGHRYIHGLYGRRGHGASPSDDPSDRQSGAVYVGAGIGAAVMPVRLGERGQRELAVFELGATPDLAVEHHPEQAPHGPPSGRDEAEARAAAQARFARRHQRRFGAPRLD